jgi:hypothetical protein
MTVFTFAEKIASELLACAGSSAVWQLHLVAATAYRDGNARAADSLLEIADAAEREVVIRGGYSTNEIVKQGGSASFNDLCRQSGFTNPL